MMVFRLGPRLSGSWVAGGLPVIDELGKSVIASAWLWRPRRYGWKALGEG